MFIENKYFRWYFNIIGQAEVQNRTKKSGVYYESHHIIPKCMGGCDIVLLTAKEHFICHLLLPKMTEGVDRHKMINALIRMSFSKSENQNRYKSKSYSVVRSMIAEKNKEMFSGVKKSEKTRQNMKGRSGTWKREDKHKERMRGPSNPMFGMTGDKNNARKSGIGNKISQSKIGRKRIYREDGTHYYERL